VRSKPCFGKTKTLASATLRKFRFTLFIDVWHDRQ
jgi:hypothetical protein